ncbi:EAL domain-containing protein [Roseomonas sp. HJA6]|uniref:cyclic-guanylate-specific phosphodiesterase n=1 Tax=Roseomonas alba TaxID=2846776 RepID=A0ABS7AH99_9PROT|nr:EAL domain-containing protein [Neoroseomonas alba]MBW6401102.1 EAL domain-containing protein [Neoroseomonas alba]
MLLDLSEYAKITLGRFNDTISQANTALGIISSEQWDDCSPAHIGRMRQLSVDIMTIDEIVYYRNGRLSCTIWGNTNRAILERAPDHTLPNGVGITLNVESTVSRGGSMVAVSHRGHAVLVKPQRMVDVLLDTHATLGVAMDGGRLVALSGSADPELLAVLTSGPAVGADARHFYASVGGPGFIAFAIAERSAIEGRWREELWLLLPLGGVVSLVLVATVAWFSRHRLSLRSELASAIRNGELVVHYQPIMSLGTGRCVGAEALVRWQQPDGRMIPPDSFIPIAEEFGLIADITDFMIDRVVRDLADMLAIDRSVYVAINIGASDIGSGRFLPVLDRALARWNVAAPHVWLEATERGFVDADAARKTITAARAAGHLVAIDDFGTGYSSLSLLEKLPLDALKIDKAFVDSIGKDAATSIVIPHIIGMAKELSLAIVAEGIETEEQVDYLRKAGVKLGQGWLYAKAMPLGDIIDYYGHNKAGPWDGVPVDALDQADGA